MTTSGSDPTDRIARIEQACVHGLFREALALLSLEPSAEQDIRLAALRRMCLARLGQVEAAAALGADIAARSTDKDDWFRYAQLCNSLGRWREALPWALRALQADPFNVRYVEGMAHAALGHAEGLASTLDTLRQTPFPAAPLQASTRTGLLVPQRLPHYTAYDGDHHAHMGLVERLTGTAVDILPATAWQGAAALAAALPVAAAASAEIQAAAGVERRYAVEYVANRVAGLLIPPGGWQLEFITSLPMTLGQRPWVLWFDILPNLFAPFLSLEAMMVDDRTPWYRIVKAALEAPTCRAICSHYPVSRGCIAEFFHSRTIADKTVHINSWDRGAEGPPPPFRGQVKPAGTTLLFTSSRTHKDAGFYFRGGVDLLVAFERLAERFPTTRLILRSPLPGTLSDRLKHLVRTHPRILWVPDFLEAERYDALLAEADIFVMPGAVLYRNALMETLRQGIIPVVGDTPGIEEIISDGHNGVIVPGRRHLFQIDTGEPMLRTNLSGLLRATDEPFDPVFHGNLTDALTALVEQPDRLFSLRHPPNPATLASSRDRRKFESLIHRATHGGYSSGST